MVCLRSSCLSLDREASLPAALGAPSESQEWFRSVSEIFQNNRRLVCYPDLARNKDYSIYCLKSNQRRVFVAVNPETSRAVILADQNIQGNEHHLVNHAQLVNEGLARVQRLYNIATRLLPPLKSAAAAASSSSQMPVKAAIKQPLNIHSDPLVNGVTPASIVNTFKLLDIARRGSEPYEFIFSAIARIISYPRVSLWLTRSSKTLFLNYQLDRRPFAQADITDFKLKDYLFLLFEGIKGRFNPNELSRYVVFLLSSVQAHPEFIREEMLSTDLTQVVWSRAMVDQLVIQCQVPICYPTLQAILERFQLWNHLSTTAGQKLLELPIDKDIGPLLPFMTSSTAKSVLARYQGPLMPILELLKGQFFCEKLEICSKRNDNGELLHFLEREYQELSDAEKQCYQLGLDGLRNQLLKTPFERYLTPIEETVPPSLVARASSVAAAATHVPITDGRLLAPFMQLQKVLLDTMRSISNRESALRSILNEVLEILERSFLLSSELNKRLEQLVTRTYKLPPPQPGMFSLEATLFSVAVDFRNITLLIEIVRYFQRLRKFELLEKFYGNALFNAALSANVIAAEFCLSLGFSANRTEPASGITPLFLACRNTKNQPHAKVLALVQVLIRGGASLDQQTVLGDTPLSISVVRKSTEVVRELLAHGANPNVPLGGGYLCLDIAASLENRGLIDVLLAHGAKVGKGPTRMVFNLGNQEIVIEPSPHLRQACERFAQKFMTICRTGNGKLEDLRAKACRPPHFFSFHSLLLGVPALHHALFGNQSNILHELVEIDQLSLDTLAHFSDDIPGLQMMRTILPKPFAVLHLAIILERVDEVIYLLDRGASVDIEDGRGWTPLFYGSHLKNEKLFNLLLSRGANPHHRAENNITLIDTVSSNSPFRSTITSAMQRSKPHGE